MSSTLPATTRASWRSAGGVDGLHVLAIGRWRRRAARAADRPAALTGCTCWRSCGRGIDDLYELAIVTRTSMICTIGDRHAGVDELHDLASDTLVPTDCASRKSAHVQGKEQRASRIVRCNAKRCTQQPVSTLPYSPGTAFVHSRIVSNTAVFPESAPQIGSDSCQ